MKKYREDLQEAVNRHFSQAPKSPNLERFLAEIEEKFEAYDKEIELLSDSYAREPYKEICEQFNYGRIVFNRKLNCIQSYNEQVLEQFQYTRDELNQFLIEDILLNKQPEKATKTVAEFKEEIQGFGPKDHKFYLMKFKRKDGSEFWMDTGVVTFPSPHEHLLVFVLRNIDKSRLEEEKNEELLIKLESVNDELRDFAYVVSHDLKAPLRGIMSITRWLGSDYKDVLDEEGTEMLNLLETRTSRLQQLIDGVLAYSKISHGGEEFELVDVQDLVEGIIDFLAAPEHIHISINQALPTLYFEPTKLGQIFQNIISNSIKYMDKSQGLIEVGCEDRGNMWEFYISDNGPGIEKTYHDKIFQIFQTLHTRDEVESTGIGLSIVKKIIDKFGGEIWLDSTPGEGCSFYFKLPKNIEEVRPNKEYEKWVQST